MDIDLNFEIKAAISQYENVKNLVEDTSIKVEEEIIFDTDPIEIDGNA